MKYVAFFDQITREDGALYGGKNAALGEMYQNLSAKGIRVPYGFAVSTNAYWKHLEENGLLEEIQGQLELIQADSIDSLVKAARAIRARITAVSLPEDVTQEIIEAYAQLSVFYQQEASAVAVRSSATAEDLPEASFAGQQETFLNINGVSDLIEAVVKCMASLFTERAIVYRRSNAIRHMDVGLSVCVQKMIRADLAVSGVMFTLETESGHRNFISINSSYGLGEPIVQGQVNPDEFLVAKEQLRQGYFAIVRRFLGAKEKQMVYRQTGFFDRLFPFHSGANPSSVVLESVSPTNKLKWSLTDEQVIELARVGLSIEDYYTEKNGRWTPMDIEWAYDGEDGLLYVVQARPETVHGNKEHALTFSSFSFVQQPGEGNKVCEGARVGYGIVSGRARILASLEEEEKIEEGDILVATMTDPDWLPVMERAAAIVTEQGGRACHAAIVSRELGIPAIVGSIDATEKIVDGEVITLDCSAGDRGNVYRGIWEAQETTVLLAASKTSPVALQLNTSDPLRAIDASFLPVDGVGLARLEFVISGTIGVHPQACAHPELVQDAILREVISEKLVAEPEKWAETFIHMLAESIGTIAAAFYPRRVLVRTSDFKSNEYASLLAGNIFEGEEANPMLGLRGAARYLDPAYQDAFWLELKAFDLARKTFGLTNCQVMIPFIRSSKELAAVVQRIEAAGLVRGENGFELAMMVELPENILSMEEYLPYCDGFSIGSNDLTQLVLGVDRDTQSVQHLYDENDPAVHAMIIQAIEKAHMYQKSIGICGQGPADSQELREFLIHNKIDYVSMTADAVVRFLADL